MYATSWRKRRNEADRSKIDGWPHTRKKSKGRRFSKPDPTREPTECECMTVLRSVGYIL